MAIRRVNRGKNHTYYIDEKKADGVTTVINNGMPKPALAYWAARETATAVASWGPQQYAQMREQLGIDGLIYHLKNVPWALRDAAAARGTEVHRIAEGLLRGDEVEVPTELDAYVDSAVAFMQQWKPRPVLTETVVGSYRWGYAGTFDLIADLPDGRRVLFDYKTSSSGIWPETALQLAAYRHADVYVGTDGVTEVPMSEVGIDEAMAVWVRPDGYDVVPLDTGEHVFRAFLHVQYVARVSDDMKSWVKPAVIL